tara:strand:+ start:98 stop:481 length:384 start_codon:yes stop_codon:yes gene_type:complete
MKWNEKTEAQYDAYMTIMAGGDNEGEANLSEDEWCTITVVLNDFLAVFTGEVDLDYLVDDCYGGPTIDQLKSVIAKINKVEEFDADMIVVSEIDLRRIQLGKESIVDFFNRKKAERETVKDQQEEEI